LGAGGEPDGVSEPMRDRGQVVVIVAIALTVILLLLAVAVDGGRLYVQRSRLNRSAQAAADAGIGQVSELMVTLAVERQTEAAARAPCAPDGEFGEKGARCTETPMPADIAHWLTDEDRDTLVAPEVQKTAMTVAREYAARNGLDRTDPDTELLRFSYPYAYDVDGPILVYRVEVRQSVEILLAGLLGRAFAQVDGVGQSEIPQR
jgi:type II secretory pathway pseudopilin PulG